MSDSYRIEGLALAVPVVHGCGFTCMRNGKIKQNRQTVKCSAQINTPSIYALP